jgi:hypothetical protein
MTVQIQDTAKAPHLRARRSVITLPRMSDFVLRTGAATYSNDKNRSALPGQRADERHAIEKSYPAGERLRGPVLLLNHRHVAATEFFSGRLPVYR